jgi:hypothetical protein
MMRSTFVAPGAVLCTVKNRFWTPRPAGPCCWTENGPCQREAFLGSRGLVGRIPGPSVIARSSRCSYSSRSAARWTQNLRKLLRRMARRTGRFPQLVDPRSSVNGLLLTGSPRFREVSLEERRSLCRLKQQSAPLTPKPTGRSQLRPLHESCRQAPRGLRQPLRRHHPAGTLRRRPMQINSRYRSRTANAA